MSKFISKTEAEKLKKKLNMKYGAKLEEINLQIQDDVKLYGFVTMETEIKKEKLFDEIRSEEKYYR